MTTYKLIFSDQDRHRISRHLIFWLGSFLFFLITVYIPVTVIPEWDSSHVAAAVKRVGGIGNWIELRLVNSLITFIPFIPIAYLINYFVLPRFFLRKNWIAGIGWILVILMLNLAAAYISMHQVMLNNYKAGPAGQKLAPIRTFFWATRITLLTAPL